MLDDQELIRDIEWCINKINGNDVYNYVNDEDDEAN